jgi:hypothetical protein
MLKRKTNSRRLNGKARKQKQGNKILLFRSPEKSPVSLLPVPLSSDHQCNEQELKLLKLLYFYDSPVILASQLQEVLDVAAFCSDVDSWSPDFQSSCYFTRELVKHINDLGTSFQDRPGVKH